jgi:hypothetical protein
MMDTTEGNDTQEDGLLDDDQISDLLGSSQHTVDLAAAPEEPEHRADNAEASQEEDKGIEPDDEESRRAGLRQADYTKKTQGLADERRAFEAEKAAWKARMEMDSAPPPEATGPEPPDPELAKTEPARYLEELVDYRATLKMEGVQQELAELRAAREQQREQFAPMLAQQRVVDAYRSFQSEQPSLDHKSHGPAVGKLLETDPDLGEMAVSDPGRAIRLASRLVQAESRSRASKTTTSRRRAAAPVAARRGGSVAAAPPAADLNSAWEFAWKQMTGGASS